MALPKVMTFRGTDLLEVKTVSDTSEYTNPLGPFKVDSVQGFELEIEFDEDELFGDEEKKDVYAKIIGMKGSWTSGQVNLETLGIMTDGTLAESGTTPSQMSKLSIGPTRPPYLRWRFVCLYQGGEDAGANGAYEIEIFKARLTAPKLSVQSKAYGELSGGFNAALPVNLPSGESVLAYGTIKKVETAA